MTRADFDAKFAICLASAGAPYIAARDAIRAAGKEVDPWLVQRTGTTNPRERQVAQALQFWRATPEIATFIGAVAAGGGTGTTFREPTVTGHYGPTRAATLVWSLEQDVVVRLVELVDKERSETADGYEGALLALGYCADPRAVPALVDLLAQPDDETHHASVLAALGEIADPAGADAALAKLSDPAATPSVRSAALVALGQMGDVRAVPTMLAVATDPGADGMLRRSAAAGLGNLGEAATGSVVTALAALARGTDERLALGALHALRTAGTNAARSAIAALQQSATVASVQSAARDATTGIA